MSTENIVLLSNITTDSVPATFSYGEKKKAAGYHRISDGLHTAVYTVNSFSGTIKIQGTLALYPGDNDWFDIGDAEIGGDSNFLWIRAAYNLQSGTIVDVRFNY